MAGDSPFPARPGVRARIAALADRVGPAVAAAVDPQHWRISREWVDRLIATHDLTGPSEVMLLALPAARSLARPPISGYRVGAVALERDTGDLLLGANLELPGSATLATTVHAEGGLALRAFQRGTSLERLAIDQARPCAYCRQTLMEFAWADELRLIDPLGHDLGLRDLYPWPFAPQDLGDPGAVPGAEPWPDLRLDHEAFPPDVAATLVAAGRRAHAPYSRAPAAAVIVLRDGQVVGGATVENVAFDPSVGPFTVALVAALARGADYADLAAVHLAVTPDGPVDHERGTRLLLDAIRPDVPLHVWPWS